MNYSITSTGEGGPWLPAFLAIALMVLWVLLQLVLAVSVTNNIKRLRQDARGPVLLGTVGWGFFTLMTGPIGFAFYWVMHHSNLRDPKSDMLGLANPPT
jgi:hypothetical protein